MLEIFFRCKRSLSFLSQSNKQTNSEDLDDEKTSGGNFSPLKNNFNYQGYDDIPHSSNDENNADFFDNNYWNTKVSDFDLEIN